MELSQKDRETLLTPFTIWSATVIALVINSAHGFQYDFVGILIALALVIFSGGILFWSGAVGRYADQDLGYYCMIAGSLGMAVATLTMTHPTLL